ncbi:MAG: ATP phosphoribosyltransferase regulatory subunit, partial [Planctomycetes bacterium]|nr:ATP phosphoribosyltransferase regulatory subunit [Planctomycetota bacterium]
ALGVTDDLLEVGLTELAAVLDGCAAAANDHVRVEANLRIARGLDYYTGTVYETFLDAHPEIGSICSGGRYDDLASLYTKSRLPGVGMSIGLTRLFYQLQELGIVGDGAAAADVLVTQQDPDHYPDYLVLASILRAAGLRTESILEPWKFKKQMKYANATGVPFVVIVGASEREAGTVTVKDMRSGDQFTAARAAIAATIRDRLVGVDGVERPA